MPNGCKRIKLYDESREGYWGFLTPEASKTFQKYVNMRKRNGEDINEESYALITYNFQTKKIDYLNDEDLSAMLKNLIKNSKIVRKKVGKHYDKAQTYGFRKRFNGILKLDDQINSNIAEKLMGHSVTIQLDNHYLTVDGPRVIEKCFDEFKKAIPELTIDGEARKQAELEQVNEEKNALEKSNLELKEMKKRNDLMWKDYLSKQEDCKS
jgi:integrase/recombinase XerD